MKKKEHICKSADRYISELFGKYEIYINKKTNINQTAKEALINGGKVLCHYAANHSARDGVIYFFKSSNRLIKKSKITQLKSNLESMLKEYSNSIEHDGLMDERPDSEFCPEGKEEADEVLEKLRNITLISYAQPLSQALHFQEQLKGLR